MSTLFILILGGIIFYWIINEYRKSQLESEARAKIASTISKRASSPPPPVVEFDDFSESVMIEGGYFIRHDPRHDPMFENVRNITEKDLPLGVIMAFLRTYVDKNRKSVEYHQIYLRIRTYGAIGSISHGGSVRDNNARIYSGIDIPGTSEDETWERKNKAILSFQVRDFAIRIDDEIIQSFQNDMKFKINTHDNEVFFLDLPISYVKAQISAVHDYCNIK